MLRTTSQARVKLHMTILNLSFILVGFFLGVFITSAFAVFYNKQKNKDLNAISCTLAAREKEKAVLETRLEMEQTKNEEQSLLLKQSPEILGKEFENLANRIFDAKQEKFSQDSQRTLNSSIAPLREEITRFHKQVEDSHHRENSARNEMNGTIKELMKQTDLVRGETSSLASALKGDSKSQGNWGEMILERMLENSGLSSPREYETQKPHKDQQGQLRYPDVIIHMPDKKDMVVDSKVSLTAYERYRSETDPGEQKKHLKLHIHSIKNHIKDLSEKSYQELYGINTLDFVILFIPIEGAFTLALQEDDRLFDDAYKNKNIILTSPSTLMIALRIVENVWRFERQNINAQKISDEAAKLYDKMATVVESLEDIDKHIKKSQAACDSAKSQLITGSGNVINRFNKIKKLGPNTKKIFPADWSSETLDQDDLSLCADRKNENDPDAIR